MAIECGQKNLTNTRGLDDFQWMRIVFQHILIMVILIHGFKH